MRRIVIGALGASILMLGAVSCVTRINPVLACDAIDGDYYYVELEPGEVPGYEGVYVCGVGPKSSGKIFGLDAFVEAYKSRIDSWRGQR